MSNYGIDMGTSYIKVSKLKDGKVQAVNINGGIMSVFGGEKQIISAVFLQKNGEFLIGSAAYNVYRQEPSRYVSEFKRNLGQSPYMLGGKLYTAQDLYTEVFRFIVREMDRQNDPVGRVVLTVPAVYTEEQKNLVKVAAQKAGLADVVLLEEPVAAANYYASTKTINVGEKILVYDLGGGTFDVALIESTADGYRLLSEPRGLSACGGALFDDVIFADLKDKVRQIAPAALSHEVFCLELAQTATKIKHMLSTVESYEEPIMVGFDTLKYQIERRWFESQIEAELENTLALCDEVIADAGLKPRDIHRILPTGGTSTMPIVTRLLEAHYPQSMLCGTEEPSMLVCYGAALQANTADNTDDSSFQDIERRALRGDAQAQYMLGQCYENAWGVGKNAYEAVKWYGKAAIQGQVPAQYSLGYCYDNGEGVKENTTVAFTWYRRAAKQGLAAAQYKLGVCYEKGRGVSADISTARIWYKKAADQGFKDAQTRMNALDVNSVSSGTSQSFQDAQTRSNALNRDNNLPMPMIIFKRYDRTLGATVKFAVRLDQTKRLQDLPNGSSFTATVTPGTHRIEIAVIGPMLERKNIWWSGNCILSRLFDFERGDILVIEVALHTCDIYWKQKKGVKQEN